MKPAGPSVTPSALSVMETTLLSGALLESPSGGGPTGRKWRVRVFEYGLSKNRYPIAGESASPRGGSASAPLQWTERSGRAALRHLDGARCFADHVSENGGNGHSVRDLVGFFSEPALASRGPEATLTLLESESWARNKLLGAWLAGKMDLIGFSVDAVIGVRPAGEGAARVLEVDDIVAIHSVDMVSAASSGGRALDVLEARQQSGVRSQESESEPRPQGSGQKGVTMKQQIQRILETLPPASPLQEVLESELAGPEVNPARVLAALADWLSSHEAPAAEWPPEMARVREQVQALRQQIGDAVRRQRVAENRLLVDGKLAASRLPKPLAELVAARFRPNGSPNGSESGPLGVREFSEAFGIREISEEEIDMEIQRVREAYAAVSPVGKVMETGRVKVVREPEEKLQMALDRLFGLPVQDTAVPAFHGVREAYVTFTGDGEVTGMLPHQLRIREDLTSTSFPNALGNTLRRLLLKDYREQDYGIGLIAQFSSVPDFRTQERTRVGYFGDLPTVDPEAADYDELTAPTDEKASYSVVTFGGLVTITRKMIINDDLGVVPTIVSRLGRSARRTLAQRVFNLMINNAAIYDGIAWFHATHGNLGSTALSAAELDIVRTAMRNRTEKDSGKKLGIAPYVLVVPHELEGLARQENEREYTDASFTPNRVRFLFGPSSERIIVSPLLSDTNDWYVFANVNEAPAAEVGFLQGRQEPEFFLADNPSSGAVFTSDRIRYKVRHEHEAVVIDFRGAYKEVV